MRGHSFRRNTISSGASTRSRGFIGTSSVVEKQSDERRHNLSRVRFYICHFISTGGGAPDPQYFSTESDLEAVRCLKKEVESSSGRPGCNTYLLYAMISKSGLFTYIAVALLVTAITYPTTANPSEALASQTIHLRSGWNLVALMVEPADPSMAGLFASVRENVVLVRDKDGRTFSPTLGIDDIGNWDVRQAYHVFTRVAVMMEVRGTAQTRSPVEINLTSGWNLVPYVEPDPTSVVDYFGLSDIVEVVRDQYGRKYTRSTGSNEIGYLEPGQGYQVFASRSGGVRVPERTTRKEYLVPASIDAPGAEDVSHLLMDFIASVPDSSIIRFPEGAVFRIERTIEVLHRNDLTFLGGSFITDLPTLPELSSRGNRTRSHWRVRGGSNITFRGTRIRGAHPDAGTHSSAYVSDLEAQHGFDILGVKGVVIEDCAISDVYGDFIYIGSRNGWTEDVRVSRCKMERTGRQGIAITGGRRIVIEESYLAEVRRSVFDLEANTDSGGAEYVTIRRNHVVSKRLTWLANDGRGSNIRHIVIEDNVSDTAMDILVLTPEGHRRGPFKIINNRSSASYGSLAGRLMEFRRVDGLEVRGNYHRLQRDRDMYGARLTDCTDFVIEDNDFPNSIGQYIIRETN
jgi:hypothetical protein